MRFGLIGPADGNASAVSAALRWLLFRETVDLAVYLGDDDAAAHAVAALVAEVGGADRSRQTFLDRAAELAERGSSEEIDSFLDGLDKLERLERVRTLPAPPARAIEMLEDRLVLLVHDKSILDEEDIANASVVVFGKSPELLVRRFGPRTFFTPGPLDKRRIGVLTYEPDGKLLLGVYDAGGELLQREALAAGRGPKVTVTP